MSALAVARFICGTQASACNFASLKPQGINGAEPGFHFDGLAE
jgi:hypothetical protein